MAFCAETLKYDLRGLSCGAVGAVKSYLHAVKAAVNRSHNKISVGLYCIVLRAYLSQTAVRRPEIRLCAVKHNGFNFFFKVIGELIALLAEYLDTVEFRAIMASGYHYAAVRAVPADKVSKGRSRHDSQKLRVRAH